MTPELQKALDALKRSAEQEKARHASAVDETIALVERVATTGDNGLEDSICSMADCVNESFRFELLDFLNAYGLRKS